MKGFAGAVVCLSVEPREPDSPWRRRSGRTILRILFEFCCEQAMALFSQDALNPGVRRREVFGWAAYDFANSGYTTVVLTAVFSAYFVGGVAGGADWATPPTK